MERDTRRKVLKAFEEADPSNLSIKEASEHAGVNRMSTSTWIKVLVAEGRLELLRERRALAVERR